MKTLTIISHTEHYKMPNGQIAGLGSTVTEINNLLDIFDRIYHVAMLYKSEAPANALPYSSSKVTFVPIPAVGGPYISDKLRIIWQAPTILYRINSTLSKSDYFQFRAPTGIGVFVMPFLIVCTSKKGWFKYAGNWKQKGAPIAYRFQRWLLKRQSRPVTINGYWEDQPKHSLSFENPCLTNDEYLNGQQIIQSKYSNFDKFNFCFVGRLEKEKGVDVLIDAFKKLSIQEKKQIGWIDIVGCGSKINRYKGMTKDSELNFIFHGLLSREKVRDLYKKSNAILLPSSSEGFPKVIAEAMNYGCIPIVSNVSSIEQYITDGQNGLLIKTIDAAGVLDGLRRLLELNVDNLDRMIKSNPKTSKPYTYAYYNHRIVNEICEKT